MDPKILPILSRAELAALDKEARKGRLDSSMFESLRPEEMAAATVTKAAFFELHPTLPRMTSEAAEQTYSQWITTRRVIESRIVTEDPTGIKEDEVSILLPARYVNSERRRFNVNKRRAVEHSQLTGTPIPADFR